MLSAAWQALMVCCASGCRRLASVSWPELVRQKLLHSGLSAAAGSALLALQVHACCRLPALTRLNSCHSLSPLRAERLP